MRFILVILLLSLAACGRTGSSSETSGEKFGVTSGQQLSGTWFKMNGAGSALKPEGVQITFSNGTFTLTEISNVAVGYGGTAPRVVSFGGTYIENGEDIILKYDKPICMQGMTESIKVEARGSALLITRDNWPEAFLLETGEILEGATTPQTIYKVNCYNLGSYMKKVRKPASLKK